MARLGWCCKWLDPDRTKDKKTLAASEQAMNLRASTLTHMKTLSSTAQRDKTLDLIDHNIKVLWNHLRWLATQPSALRMARIGSEFVPVGTFPGFDWVWTDSVPVSMLDTGLRDVRSYAAQHGIRLSMHPGQFVVLNSVSDDVVDRAIAEFECHARIAEFMGFGDTRNSDGFAINVHAGSRDGGLSRLVDNMNRLSKSARNLITIENDEMSWGIDQFLDYGLDQHVSLVLDIHHHWVNTGGEFIQPDDARIERIRASWQGVQPLSHYSVSRPDYYSGWNPDVLPDYQAAIKAGHKKKDLRAHSDLYWNRAANVWAASHLSWTDIECEAKSKNLASHALYEEVKAKI